jgi:hypothetical protein
MSFKYEWALAFILLPQIPHIHGPGPPVFLPTMPMRQPIVSMGLAAHIPFALPETAAEIDSFAFLPGGLYDKPVSPIQK